MKPESGEISPTGSPYYHRDAPREHDRTDASIRDVIDESFPQAFFRFTLVRSKKTASCLFG